MVARATPSDVQEIFAADFTLTPYITAAHQIVDERLKCGMTEAELKEVERWLAAHFASIAAPTIADRTGGVSSDSFGDASRSWGFALGDGLKATMYGQTALSLDRCGALAKLGKRSGSWDVL